MTPSLNIIPLSEGETGNLDTSVAIQAAFGIGRKQYLRERRSVELQPCVDRALAALSGSSPPASSPSPETVVSGGRSLRGKIMCALKANDGLTRSDLSKLLKEDVYRVTASLAVMRTRDKCVAVKGRGPSAVFCLVDL